MGEEFYIILKKQEVKYSKWDRCMKLQYFYWFLYLTANKKYDPKLVDTGNLKSLII